MKNLQKVNSALVNSRTSDVVVAQSGKKLAACSQHDLGILFKKILVIIGVSETNTPEKVEWDILLQIIPATFGNYTDKEVTLAFQLALQKRTNVDLSIYDKPFSLEYLSRVLSAYQKYKSPIMTDFNKEQEQEMTEEQKQALSKRNIISTFQEYKDTGNVCDFGGMVHKNLHTMGLLQWTEIEILDLMNQAEEQLEASYKYNLQTAKDKAAHRYYKAIVEALPECLNTGEPLAVKRQVYRELSLKKYFRELIDAGKDIGELI